MHKFTTLTGIPAPLDEAKIDTDLMLPARFLLLMNKEGLGKHLFKDRRTGDLRTPHFVLDTTPYETSNILVTGPRFGIGSSREQAVWALTDFGVRCIIAPSFGDIFFANCLKNGLLPIRLGGIEHERLMQTAKEKTPITIDLPAQRITFGLLETEFDVPQRGKRLLLSGQDETDAILTHETAAIEAFETCQKAQMPWLYAKKELKRKKMK